MYEELVKRLKITAQLADHGLRIPASLCLEAAHAIATLCSFIGAEDAERMEAYPPKEDRCDV